MSKAKEIEFTYPKDGHSDAGYLRLKWSEMIDAFCVDIITVRPPYRRQGIGSALMGVATEMLGYEPKPEAILDNATAPGFWAQRGHTTGFNQSVLE